MVTISCICAGLHLSAYASEMHPCVTTSSPDASSTMPPTRLTAYFLQGAWTSMARCCSDFPSHGGLHVPLPSPSWGSSGDSAVAQVPHFGPAQLKTIGRSLHGLYGNAPRATNGIGTDLEAFDSIYSRCSLAGSLLHISRRGRASIFLNQARDFCCESSGGNVASLHVILGRYEYPRHSNDHLLRRGQLLISLIVVVRLPSVHELIVGDRDTEGTPGLQVRAKHQPKTWIAHYRERC